MTSADWCKEWTVFESVHSTDYLDISTKLGTEGIIPATFTAYGRVADILQAMGLNPQHSHIWNGTYYVGTVEDLDGYIEDMKIIWKIED